MNDVALSNLESATTAARIRWWNSLAFRLGVVINLTAVVVSGGFWAMDYRRERSVHLENEVDRLGEEAGVLRTARAHFSDAAEFERFVDNFCRQMSAKVSPGHHILAFDNLGNIVVRAHERAEATLEAKMAEAHPSPAWRFTHRGAEYVAVSVPDSFGGRIVVAQSLQPLEAIIRAQALSRAASLGVLAVLVFGITMIVLVGWVRTPLHELVRGLSAVGQGRLDARVRASGTRELRYLAERVNEMAGALEGVAKRAHAEMRHAREIQRRRLPADGISVPGCTVAALFEPADSVGGDMYDVIPLPDGRVLLAVLDVSGHGVPAALYAALLRTILRREVMAGADLPPIVAALNDELINVVGSSGEFATCLLVRLDPHTGALDYLGAGHDAAIVVRPGSSPQFLEGDGLPLGIAGARTEHVQAARLEPGDRLFLYTDGLHEVFDERGEQFGRERLVELLAATSAWPPADQLRRSVERLRQFAAGHSFLDDLTLLCAVRGTSADPASHLAEQGLKILL
jgi:serine phosphatase RsbU (regulator of sigma subunit)